MEQEKRIIADAILNRIDTISSFFEFYEMIVNNMAMCSIEIALIFDENYFQKSENTSNLISSIRREVGDERSLNSFTMQYLKLVRKTFDEIASTPENLLSNKELVLKHHNIDISINTIATFQSTNSINLIENKLNILSNFRLIGQIDQSIVIVGANGSGKSSYSRKLKTFFGENITVISAQKVFLYQELADISISEKSTKEFYTFQKDEKMWRDINAKYDHPLINEFTNLIKTLIKFHMEEAVRHFNSHNPTVPGNSILEKTCKLWNDIVQHRSMTIDDHCNIIIHAEDEKNYGLNYLSDGEKAIFYYIGNILLATHNSYIIVDEPENHLHTKAMLRLWNKLELERIDCKFIFLTHNLQFAASRNKTKKIWMKRFIAPNNWEMQSLPDSSTLPEELLIEILGCKNSILFCEGSYDSIDYELFTILFDNYSVIPVGGHENVCHYTRAFNQLQSLHENKAIGIIDGDFHRDEFIKKWNRFGVYCLECCEVENLLCDEMLLQEANKKLYGDDNSVTKAKEQLLKYLRNEIETQVSVYTRDCVNNCLKEYMIKKINFVSDINEELNRLPEKINVTELALSRREFLNKILIENNYEDAFKHFCNKGLASRITKSIDKDYCKKIIKLLNENTSLQHEIKQKYFSHVMFN